MMARIINYVDFLMLVFVFVSILIYDEVVDIFKTDAKVDGNSKK